jgi:hypothetical protein
MNKKASFSYSADKGNVTRIGPADTSKFLKVGELPANGKDRSLSREAIATIDLAYEWCEKLRTAERNQ